MTNEHETVGDVARLEKLIDELFGIGCAVGGDRPYEFGVDAAQRKWSEIREAIRRIERAHAREAAAQVGVPEGWALVPRELTAENGAKYRFIGEMFGGYSVPWAAVKALHREVVAWAKSAAPAPAAEPAHTSPEPRAAVEPAAQLATGDTVSRSVVAHRLLRPSSPSYSKCARWMDGAPRQDLIDAVADDPRWRLQLAYGAPAPQPAPSDACDCVHAKRKQCAQLRQATDCIVCQCACHERKPAPSDAPASPQAAQGDVEALAQRLCDYAEADDLFPQERADLYAAARILSSAQPATAKPAADDAFAVGDRVEWVSNDGTRFPATVSGFHVEFEDGPFVVHAQASSLTRLTGGSHE